MGSHEEIFFYTTMLSLSSQIIYLFVLAIPVACISWTCTHEEVFREPRMYCVRKSKKGKNLLTRKFFFLFTCEYCFSHYITIGMLWIAEYRLLFDDWRGILVGGFSIVWIANIYMSLFYLLRTDIKKDRIIIDKNKKDEPVQSLQEDIKPQSQ